jgi:hypothetical protein
MLPPLKPIAMKGRLKPNICIYAVYLVSVGNVW